VTAYNAKFQVGARVRVAVEVVLRQFVRPAWEFHHPLDPELIRFAGSIQIVDSVGFYHGGDALYQLRGVKGNWHEGALLGVDDS